CVLCSSSLRATTPCASSTLSLHDALPIFVGFEKEDLADALIYVYPQRQIREIGDLDNKPSGPPGFERCGVDQQPGTGVGGFSERSEEHTSELQSRENLVCRLLLEKKKQDW